MDKQGLRNKYKQIRMNVKSKDEQDKIIFNQVINLEEYKRSDLVLIYVSLKEEVDTIKLIKHSLEKGKKVAVPKCKENDIVFYYINSLEELEEEKFGILEPKTNEVVNDFDNSICIIPGLAFDKQNNRIGYGRGFYDRFLENYDGIKIGLVYKECICDEIDIDKNEEIERMSQVMISPSENVNRFMEEHDSTPLRSGISLLDLLKRPQFNYDNLADIDLNREKQLSRHSITQLEVQIKYAGYIEKQLKQIERFKKLEDKKLDKDFDYTTIEGLRIEAMQKLNSFKPVSVGQASRISGVSPADISVLLIYLERNTANANQ